ncbi:GNAT family N-acetyltransferase [Woodsholea maritima]|uniref:GNAT family N-acetyltransferase n=1 Tax=Woodsholea maritima TaxID=240237 RepID=UPI00038131CB|nr:GNAT family N-acetyltransferase [Woodsholea maritima]
MSELTIRTIASLSDIAREAWDALANPSGAPYDPFLSWDFLEALERSASACPETGWASHHVIAETHGEVVGVMPLYLKGHSYGEYVFDHAWADALERAGGQYYPKLLTAVPFTPATGRRFLSPDPQIRASLIQAGLYLTQTWKLSSWHITFPDEAQWHEAQSANLLPRIDRQYIWLNKGYDSYEDFLGDLSSRKRKALKKERQAAQAGLEIQALGGAELSQTHWDIFFECYQDTGSRKWGHPYLTREFFSLIQERRPEDILMVMAKKDGRWIACALNFIGSEALYGRYWGRLDDHPFLHFELCYHQAIDYAIAKGLSRVEAGAQGEHKLARGYRPMPVYSAHYIAEPALHAPLERYLRRERDAVLHDIACETEESPFKAGC